MIRSPRLGGPADVLLALLAGAVHSLLFVHTAAWPLQFVVVGLLVARLARASTRRAAAIGWAFGTAWVAAGTWWLFISMHRYGGLLAPLAAAAVVVLAGSLSLYLAAASAAFARWRRGRLLADASLFAALWMLAELARGVIFTGFPWLASGYAQPDGPLARLAPWVGVYGIGAAVAFLGALLGLGVAGAAQGAGADERPRGRSRAAWSGPLLALLLVGLAAALPASGFSRSAGSLRVALLQTNVPQDQKFDADRLPRTLAGLRASLLAADANLVMAPETAIPVLPVYLDDAWWQPLRDRFGQPGRSALIGLPLGSASVGYSNSVAGLSADFAAGGAYYRYDKHHLVPFGEFIPTGFRWFTEMMRIPLGDFLRGPLAAPSFEVRGADGSLQRVAPNICYEDLFGEELSTRFRAPGLAPTVFANHSNIAWFGDTVAIEQHLQISRMRTLEFERPMLRSTNTGATVVIDHLGVVTARLPAFTQGTLTATVEGREGLTPFARWSAAAGLWPPVLLALTVVGVAASRRRRP